MDDREAMLRTIFDDEADDVPRLVYADWLEEHGEANYAAFIRMQCAYALSEAHSEENALLWHQVLGVWERLRREWRRPLNGLWKVDATSFHRGFLDWPLTMGAEKFVELSPNWWPVLAVRKAVLDLSPWTVEDLADCEELARLSALTLRGADPHGTIIPVLARCPYLGELRLLDLTEFHLGIEAIEALAQTPILDRLTELRLPYFMRPNREGARILRRRFGDVCTF